MGLRVLYVGLLPPFVGGSAISSSDILGGLASRGHAVHAVAPITPETMGQEAACARACPGVSVTRYPVPWYHTTPDRPEPEWYRAAQAAHLDRLLPALVDRERLRMLLIGRESFALPVADVTRVRGIPVVQRLAGATINGLLTGTYPEPEAGRMRTALRRAGVRVAPGRQLALAAGHLDIGDIRTVPTGIDLCRFRPREKDPRLLRELGIAPESVVVAHVSNLKPLKRPLDFVRAAVETLAREPGLVFLVVGEGALRRGMEAACRDAGISEHFRFVGGRPYEEVPRYFNLADIVVMPSESEGLSRACLETQACGRVLIASDIPPARELVRHGETGLLFPRGDVGALSELMLGAARDPALRQAIGARAHRQAQGRSLADTITSYEEILHQVAGLRMSGAPGPA